MCSYVTSVSGKLRPDTSMGTSSQETERHQRKARQHGFYECLAATLVLTSRPVYTMQQLSGRDRRDSDFFVAAELLFQSFANFAHSRCWRQATDRALKINKDRGV